jgi:DCN1-like protein 1/2
VCSKARLRARRGFSNFKILLLGTHPLCFVMKSFRSSFFFSNTRTKKKKKNKKKKKHHHRHQQQQQQQEMNKLNAGQKKGVQEFVAVTQATNTNAIKYLKKFSWNLQAAVTDYLEHPPSSSRTSSAKNSGGANAFSEATLETFFEKYQSEETKKETATDKREIDAEGICRFFDDLGLDPESDLVTLVLANKMNAQEMGKFTHEEFTKGMRQIQSDSMVKLKKKVPAMRQELLDSYAFKSVYEYAFKFSKEENQKALNLDTACAMWELLLKDKWPLLDKWCDFLNREHKKAISGDTWNQVLDFSRMYKSSLFGYDAEGKDAAWPYLIDEFVEEQMEKLKEGMK